MKEKDDFWNRVMIMFLTGLLIISGHPWIAVFVLVLFW